MNVEEDRRPKHLVKLGHVKCMNVVEEDRRPKHLVLNLRVLQTSPK